MLEDQVQCPVCGRLAKPRSEMCECGWRLSGPLRAGPVTEQMRQDWETALNGRRRAHDAHLVARITADPGPYQDYVRGGRPDAAEWKAARQAAARDLSGASDENELRAGLRGLLEDLRPGAPVTIVEVSADGIGMTTADLDQFGSPRLTGTGETATWESILPMLSGVPEEQRFQLAGGMIQRDRELALAALDGRMPRMPDGRLRVVCRVAGWEIPERAAVIAAAGPEATLRRVTGTANATPVRTLLADLAAKAPLRHAYQLMVAAVTPESGAVAIQPRELFAPGDLPGTQIAVPLRRMPGDSSEMVLAIFADGHTTAGPLALFQVRPPAGPFSLHAVLAGPGRVEILAPEGATEYPGTWDVVRGEVPARVGTAPGPVDLVCAIDLSGPTEAAQARARLVRALVKRLRTHYGDSSSLRVGVVTCTGHVWERGKRGDQVTEHLELGPPSAAAAWLKGKPDGAACVGYPDLAPVEDLLHDAFELLRGSRNGHRAAMLVTVAGRPPHPWPQPRDTRMPCPNQYMWADEIGKLTRRAGARCVMVADYSAAGHQDAAGWRKLGPGGLYNLAEMNAQRLAEHLDLIAAQGQRLPLPIPDDF